jgi:hypothetical protein
LLAGLAFTYMAFLLIIPLNRYIVPSKNNRNAHRKHNNVYNQLLFDNSPRTEPAPDAQPPDENQLLIPVEPLPLHLDAGPLVGDLLDYQSRSTRRGTFIASTHSGTG